VDCSNCGLWTYRGAGRMDREMNPLWMVSVALKGAVIGVIG